MKNLVMNVVGRAAYFLMGAVATTVVIFTFVV
jgi:hypothetical protein